MADEPQRPHRSPLYAAGNAARYERQLLIREYQGRYSCRLVILIDSIFPDSITFFEDLLFDADPGQDLHLLLVTPGGDGETAVRLVRQAQSRCRELTVLVPEQAKSAGTLLSMGAHRIVMGPTSDLGPIDPQLQLGDEKGIAAAKDIIAAVDQATKQVQEAPATYPIYASLLADLTSLMVEQARAALERTDDLLREALRSNPSRPEEEVERLYKDLKALLIDAPRSHAAIYSAEDARKAGLPILELDPQSEQWRRLWQLWAKYALLGGPDAGIYESELASLTVRPRA